MKRLMQMVTFALVFAISASALAMGLDEAKQKLDTVKQQGLVGETPTGYLAVVQAKGEAKEEGRAKGKTAKKQAIVSA